MKHRLPVGVSWARDKKCYKAQAKIDGRIKHLGYHSSPYPALLAYIDAKRVMVRKLLNENRKMQHFITKELVQLRLTQMEQRGFEQIYKYLQEREATQ
jgi:hypothetical protein